MTTSPIPAGLKQHLPYPETPWHVNDRLFKRIEDQPYEDNAHTYKKCPLFQEDPEVQLVLKYFNHNKPSNYSISNIYCIHTPSLSTKFKVHIETINTKAETLKPEWDKETHRTERERVIHRWKGQVNEFSPITVKQSNQQGREDTYPNVGILPLWHGTSAATCQLVAASGFACFGKHHYFNHNAKKGTTGSTDKGYFGSGYYFTNSAKYASMYSSGNLLLSWVSMSEPFPVINDIAHPAKGTDMKKLEGHGHYQAYNAHFIPVAPTRSNPGCMEYYPCYANQDPVCDEFVVFQEAQIVPRFWIELSIDLTKPLTLKSYPPITLPNLLNFYFSLNFSAANREKDLRLLFFRNYLRTRSAGFFLGALAGGGLAFVAESGVDPTKETNITSSKPNYWSMFFGALVGCSLGGIMGFFCGRSRNQQLSLDYQKIGDQLSKESHKTAKIITAFVTSQLGKATEQITCPLSETLLLFPARVSCGSTEPHIFEYYSIMEWISKHGICPTCKTGQAIGIERVIPDEDKKKAVIEKMHNVFLQFEALLAGLPRNEVMGAPVFSKTEQIAYLVEKVKQESLFLQMDEDKIVQKIRDQKSWIEEERYALGYYIVHQIGPMQERAEEVYDKSSSLITRLITQTKNEKIVHVLQEHQRQLWKWRNQEDALFSEKCTILQLLYKAAADKKKEKA